MFDSHAQKNILIVMLQIFDNLFHYKNIVKVQWIKRLKLCMVTMATLPPAKELKIQVVSWQNEIRTLDVLKSPTWKLLFQNEIIIYKKEYDIRLVASLLYLVFGCTWYMHFHTVPTYEIRNLFSIAPGYHRLSHITVGQGREDLLYHRYKCD